MYSVIQKELKILKITYFKKLLVVNSAPWWRKLVQISRAKTWDKLGVALKLGSH